jgi:DNA-directed RNA polymerase II subunit RPB7
MFYLSSLSKEICVYPKDLTADIKTLISNKIRELEGTVVGNYGYIISIIEFNQTSKGKVDNETGRVNYRIMYKAITFKPNIGEILNTYPIFINEHGFFCKVGHLQIFISQHMMEGWKYNSENNTWNKQIRTPIVVAKPVVKKESEESGSEESGSEESGSEEEFKQNEKIIKLNNMIKIKIIAFKINSNEITALAKIN